MDWKNIINEDWTLFLDRDGVINVRIIDGYVTKVEEFEFLPTVIEAFKIFKDKFKRIIVVTNQQGVGKGFMTIEDLKSQYGVGKGSFVSKVEATGLAKGYGNGAIETGQTLADYQEEVSTEEDIFDIFE